MAAVIAFFTGLCGLRKKTQPSRKIESGNQSSPFDSKEREQTNDGLQHKESGYSPNQETNDLDTNAPGDDNSDPTPELPLPPARIAALRGTYSCNNMTLQESMSTKKKLSTSLTIQMPRASTMAQKRDGEEDKSVRKKKLKADKSILVHPIILGEKCRVLGEEEGDEDHSQRMSKNRISHPRSLSSISISRTNSKINVNVIPVNETSEDSKGT